MVGNLFSIIVVNVVNVTIAHFTAWLIVHRREENDKNVFKKGRNEDKNSKCI